MRDERMFAFPPQIDTKMDQPEVELVIDRDKVAALGLDMQTSARTWPRSSAAIM
jgi:multidrug efflux pump subunit AcrB